MLVISTQNFAPAVGGIENLMSSLCSALAGGGEDVMVFADHQRNTQERAYDAGCQYRILRYAGIRPLRRRNKARDIRALVRNNNANPRPCLITDSWKSLELLDGGIFSTILCLAHGTEVPQRLSTYKLKRIRRTFAKATYVVANSNYTAGLLEHCVDNQEKIRVIYPGIETRKPDSSEQAAVSAELAGFGPILITLARLEPRKGQREVISLLPKLIKEFPRLLYVIIGEGPERKNLERIANDLQVAQHVMFKGKLEGAQKFAFLAGSELFVMPGSVVGADVEGFGIAYLEAASLGIPSIASNAGGAPEAVLHEQTGLICEAGNLSQLEQQILALLRDPELRLALGNQAMSRSREFLWEEKINEYRALLKR